MPVSPIQMDTANRLNRNMSLLQAGATVTIDIATPAGQKCKFRTTLIGYLPKQYVLIQYPEANKLGRFAEYIKQGAGITVRGLIEGHEGAVVAFVSCVQQTLQIPSRLIVLDFPKTVSLQYLRTAKRIDTDISAKIEIGKEYWKAIVTNISVSGCQLIVNNGESLTLVKDKKLAIIIEHFQGLQNIKLKAQICSTKPQSGQVFFGVKFDDASKEAITKLLHQVIVAED